MASASSSGAGKASFRGPSVAVDIGDLVFQEPPKRFHFSIDSQRSMFPHIALFDILSKITGDTQAKGKISFSCSGLVVADLEWSDKPPKFVLTFADRPDKVNFECSTICNAKPPFDFYFRHYIKKLAEKKPWTGVQVFVLAIFETLLKLSDHHTGKSMVTAKGKNVPYYADMLNSADAFCARCLTQGTKRPPVQDSPRGLKRMRIDSDTEVATPISSGSSNHAEIANVLFAMSASPERRPAQEFSPTPFPAAERTATPAPTQAVTTTPTPAPTTTAFFVPTPAVERTPSPAPTSAVTTTPLPAHIPTIESAPIPSSAIETAPIFAPTPAIESAPIPTPTVERTPSPAPAPAVETAPIFAPTPAIESAPIPTPTVERTPSPAPAPAVETAPIPAPTPAIESAPIPTPTVDSIPSPAPAPAVTTTPTPAPNPTVESAPAPAPSPAVDSAPIHAPTPAIESAPIPTPAIETTPTPAAAPSPTVMSAPIPAAFPAIESASIPAPTPTVDRTPTPTLAIETAPTPIPAIETASAPVPAVERTPTPAPALSSVQMQTPAVDENQPLPDFTSLFNSPASLMGSVALCTPDCSVRTPAADVPAPGLTRQDIGRRIALKTPAVTDAPSLLVDQPWLCPGTSFPTRTPDRLADPIPQMPVCVPDPALKAISRDACASVDNQALVGATGRLNVLMALDTAMSTLQSAVISNARVTDPSCNVTTYLSLIELFRLSVTEIVDREGRCMFRPS